ncbi:MAG: molybdopterin-dependent oxidoreductase [Pseudomonadota bacterium]
MITLTIDGKQVTCPRGTSILTVAERHGIKIPTLCHHPDLEPFGACRLCLVEDEKTGRLMASCVTPVAPDMTIITDSPRIKTHRTNIIRLMIAEHPESCLVCSKGNRCQLRKIAAELGVGQTDLYPMPHYKPLEQANPFISRDLNKCILCGKCIRADHELVVVRAIDYHLRGFHSRPATVHDQPLEHSHCTFCGTCVSLCPTGALSVQNTRYVGTPQRESFSICGFCGVGCSLVMGVADHKIVETNPAHQEGTVNGSTLCVRGHFAHDFLNSKDRLTEPLIRKNGALTPASWDEALEMVSNRLLSLMKTYGPQSVAFLGSSKCTNEENYLFQKIARVLLKTNNIDNGGYGLGRSVMKVLDEKTDGGCRVVPLAHLEKAEVILVLGADPTQSAPVVSYYLKRAAKKGIPLIIADPRKTELVTFSSLWLPILPHRDLELINGLAALLMGKEAYDLNFIDQFTEGFDSYRKGLASLNVARVCEKTGVGKGTLEQAAQLLQGKKSAFVVGHGILQQRYGAQCVEALFNLALLTGSLGGEGAGLYVLAKENNQVGAWDMGAVPDALPGRLPLHDNRARKEWELAWQCKLSPDRGLTMVRMIEEAERGHLKALYILGENPLRSLPQPDRVREALSRTEFIVAQDILTTETTQIAAVILPGAAFSEKGGSFTNMEGRIQSFEPVVPPPGEAKPDWQILDLLTAKMGYPKTYGSLRKIRKEMSECIPMYEALAGDKEMSWIKASSQKRLFHPEKKGALLSFFPVVAMGDEPRDEKYPFTALVGSQRYHLGSGTRTSRSDRIRDLALKGEVEISFEDGARLNVRDGDTVRIVSAYGSVVRRIKLTKGLRPGMVFVPMAFKDNEARHLIGLTPLGEPDAPGWKECPVRLEEV